jgi:hypothetical protein
MQTFALNNAVIYHPATTYSHSSTTTVALPAMTPKDFTLREPLVGDHLIHGSL